MAQRVLSPKALNRAVLARQLLLERADVAIPAALERVAGLQTQYAPSGYVGLWSRLAAFERADLTRALEQRTVVQATVMRVTIHMVAAGDYYPFTAGVRRARQAWWLAGARPRQLDRAAIDDLVACVRDALAAGPRRRADLVAVLEAGGFGRELWYAAGLWVDMVRVPPSGTWERRRADLYGLAEDWIDPVPVSEEEGLAHLVTRYLHGFGPASTADIASFTGVNVTTLRPVLEQLGLRRFSGEDGTTLLDMRDGLLPDPDTPAPVRFLPTWDASLLVHARRAGILPEQYRSLVFHTRTPHSVPTFLVDGAVAGTWRYEGGQVRLEPFGELAASNREALEEEAARLAAFHA